METSKNDIRASLQNEILRLQGYRSAFAASDSKVDLGPVNAAFPHKIFPVGAVHEFVCAADEEQASTSGFVGGILASLMQKQRAAVWISRSPSLFPPALKSFGADPDQIIFIQVPTETDLLWTMEEALKCAGLAAVVAEAKDVSFTASRRLQLAVEQSRVTGFLLRRQPKNLGSNAFVARWRISGLPSYLDNEMPGVGFPRWKVELLKVRNGKPGVWQIEWLEGSFQPVTRKLRVVAPEERRKTG